MSEKNGNGYITKTIVGLALTALIGITVVAAQDAKKCAAETKTEQQCMKVEQTNLKEAVAEIKSDIKDIKKDVRWIAEQRRP